MISVNCTECNQEQTLELEDLTSVKCRKCGKPLDMKDAALKYPESGEQGGKYYYAETNTPPKS